MNWRPDWQWNEKLASLEATRDRADYAVTPAAFNTVNNWGAGISGNLALGILCEAPATACRSPC